ncbi:MAG: MFS transporter [Thermoplasmata archaeon]
MPDLSPGKKHLILLTTSLAAFSTPFLSSAVAFAVPRIGVSFHLTFLQAALIPLVILIPLASFMIFFGRISDEIGRVSVFRYGLVLFAVSAALAPFSATYYILVALLFVLGVGAAILSTNSTAIVSYVYSSGGRGLALGINAMSVYLGLTFAPFLGGLLIEFFGWRSIFYFVAPVSAVAFFISLGSMRNIEIRKHEYRLNVRGTITFVGFILSLTLYLALGNILGFLNTSFLIAFSLIFLILFLNDENRSVEPVLPPKLFRKNRTFVASNITAFLNYVSTFSIVFVFSIYLQVILGVSPFLSGILLLPEPVMMVALSPVAGKLSDLAGSRAIASIGMLIIGISFLSLYYYHPSGRVDLMILLGILGVGFGLFSAPNTNSVMGSVDRDSSGTASGFLGTMRFTGQLLSIFLATLVLSIFMPKSLIVGMFSGIVIRITPLYFSSFTYGFRIVMLISGILSLAGSMISILRNAG